MNDYKRTKTEYIYILGIDTSCDDTSAAVLKNTLVLSNVISSQDDLHKQWGGVVPDLARRAHAERIDKVIAEALQRASINEGKKLRIRNMNAIAVTFGPGLAIALEVGINKAKQLCTEYKLPLIAVNHMEGHLLSALAANSHGKSPLTVSELIYPVIGLLISGGHTEIIKFNKLGKYELLGETLDDACGEAFDKVARMLGLGYPGAKALAEFAKKGDENAIRFPVPLEHDERVAFSFSGLKTAVYYYLKKREEAGKKLTPQVIADVAASFQKSAALHLCQKLQMVLNKVNPGIVLLGGGVVANIYIRNKLRTLVKNHGSRLIFPATKKLFADNGAMIAVAGYFKYMRGEFTDPAVLDRSPRAPLA